MKEELIEVMCPACKKFIVVGVKFDAEHCTIESIVQC